MAYFGMDKPVLYYGTGYASTLDLNTVSFPVRYTPSHMPDRDAHTSIINGHVTVHDNSPTGYGRFSCELEFSNIDSATYNIINRYIFASALIKLRLHKTAGTVAQYVDVICYVSKGPQMYASKDTNLPYPAIDSVSMTLTSVDYVRLPYMVA